MWYWNSEGGRLRRGEHIKGMEVGEVEGREGGKLVNIGRGRDGREGRRQER